MQVLKHKNRQKVCTQSGQTKNIFFFNIDLSNIDGTLTIGPGHQNCYEMVNSTPIIHYGYAMLERFLTSGGKK